MRVVKLFSSQAAQNETPTVTAVIYNVPDVRESWLN
jgi:hypothetical protein